MEQNEHTTSKQENKRNFFMVLSSKFSASSFHRHSLVYPSCIPGVSPRIRVYKTMQLSENQLKSMKI